MKKFFALVLAVAMIMSMAAVSMAATNVVDLKGPYDYDADKDAMLSANAGNVLSYGDTVYYLLKVDGDALTDYALVEKLKVKVAYEMGEELVEGVSIVKKYVDWASYSSLPADYYYFVAFKTASKATTADADVVGTLELSRKKIKDDDQVAGAYNGEIDDEEIDFAFNLFYETSWLDGAETKVVLGTGSGEVDTLDLKWDKDYALKFNSDEEVELNFGYDAVNEGTFTVDASGQGKVYLRYNTKADEAIVAANPGVKMHFINFNNVKFNRTGEFVYEMEEIAAAYKVVDGALVEIAGLEIEDDEVFFNTRVLESYVFADAELVNPVVEAPVVAPEVTNPTTGA